MRDLPAARQPACHCIHANSITPIIKATNRLQSTHLRQLEVQDEPPQQAQRHLAVPIHEVCRRQRHRLALLGAHTPQRQPCPPKLIQCQLQVCYPHGTAVAGEARGVEHALLACTVDDRGGHIEAMSGAAEHLSVQQQSIQPLCC